MISARPVTAMSPEAGDLPVKVALACSETCRPWQGRVYIDDVWGDPAEMGTDGLAESRNGHRYMLPHIMRCVPCLKGS